MKRQEHSVCCRLLSFIEFDKFDKYNVISPTLKLESAARQTWDVLVVGAGPAGALAARQLAGDGLQVLLVDRKSFPRSKVCGGCVNACAMSILRQVGLEVAILRLGGIPTTGFSLWQGFRHVTLPVSGGVAISRRSFDAALVEAAISAGAQFLDGTHAQWDRHERGLHKAVLMNSVRRELAQARVVVVAGGLGNEFLKKSRSFRVRVHSGTRIGIGATMANADGLFREGNIHMAVARHGYAGIVQVEDGSLNIAAAVDRSFIKSSGNAEAAVASILQNAGLPADRILPSEDDRDPTAHSSRQWRGTTGLTCQTSPVARDGVFLLGDAAGYVEPFTGEGIAWALASAVAVTPLVSAAVKEWNPKLARQWVDLHHRTIRRRQRLCRAVAGTLRYPFLIGSILKLLSWRPSLASGVIRRLNAEISLP